MAVNKSKQHKDICAMQAHEHLDQSSMCASSATHVLFVMFMRPWNIEHIQ